MLTNVLESCCGDYIIQLTGVSTVTVGTLYVDDDNVYWTAIPSGVTPNKVVSLSLTAATGDCSTNTATTGCNYYEITILSSTGTSILYDYIDCDGILHTDVSALEVSGICACAVFAGPNYNAKLVKTNLNCCGFEVETSCQPVTSEIMNIPNNQYSGGCVMDISGICYSVVSTGVCSAATVEWLGYPASDICYDCDNVSPPCPTCLPAVYCLNTNGTTDYDGTYFFFDTYNGYDYYTGGTNSTGFIYYTGSFWCLSDTLGGDCILFGKIPCSSNCPDLGNELTSGYCSITPTPTPNPCDTFSFDALFNCNLATPTPTPTATVTPTVTPTATPTPTPTQNCNVGIELSATTLPNPTPTPTPSITPSPFPQACFSGTVTYDILDTRFTCTTTKMLVNCDTGAIYYINGALEFDSELLPTGTTFSAIINGFGVCVTYVEKSVQSPNAYITAITAVFVDGCDTCTYVPPTPTPTITPTKTPFPTPTPSATPLY
jgi:hypothetical protein